MVIVVGTLSKRETEHIPAEFIIEIPLEVPLSIEIKPFFSRALRCVSALFGDLKPNSLHISALVGLILKNE